MKLILFLLLVTPLACSRMARDFPRYSVREFVAADQLKAAQDAYALASKTRTRWDQMGLAKKGIFYAKRCIELSPQEAACHFYEALNTGLYYQARVIGYPSGMVRITEAAQKVIEIDPTYEEGGGYRILGKLYLEAPSFNLGTNKVQRDLEKSRSYLKQAIAVAPSYPENHLFLAETLVAMKDFGQARYHVKIAREKLKTDGFSSKDQKSWHKLMQEIEKKLGEGK